MTSPPLPSLSFTLSRRKIHNKSLVVLTNKCQQRSAQYIDTERKHVN